MIWRGTLHAAESWRRTVADCKWCQDEICVNADCPMCCDYCLVPDTDGVCRFEERGEKNNG